jgi:NTE family protein
VRERDGRLAVFGRDEEAALPEAVAASCAIPAYFRPVRIGEERYVDGGVHSPTNADLLRDEQLDLVVVSSPMSLAGRRLRFGVDQAVRRWARLLLDAEAVRLRRRSTPVIAFQPTVDDLSVIGPNPMDPTRRGPVARRAYESTLRRLARRDVRDRLAALGG